MFPLFVLPTLVAAAVGLKINHLRKTVDLENTITVTDFDSIKLFTNHDPVYTKTITILEKIRNAPNSGTGASRSIFMAGTNRWAFLNNASDLKLVTVILPR